MTHSNCWRDCLSTCLIYLWILLSNNLKSLRKLFEKSNCIFPKREKREKSYHKHSCYVPEFKYNEIINEIISWTNNKGENKSFPYRRRKGIILHKFMDLYIYIIIIFSRMKVIISDRLNIHCGNILGLKLNIEILEIKFHFTDLRILDQQYWWTIYDEKNT